MEFINKILDTLITDKRYLIILDGLKHITNYSLWTINWYYHWNNYRISKNTSS